MAHSTLNLKKEESENRENSMSKVFFTSDLHLGHSNIIKYCKRPFNNADEMDEALIRNWNNVVGKDDHIYVLGDFTMRSKPSNYLRRLNGFKHLVQGNHDDRPSTDDGWTSIHKLHRIKVQGQDIVLCHYAMVVWDQSHRGSWQLYGHSHGTLPDNKASLSFDVGVDCHNYTPLSFEQVSEIMSRKKPVFNRKYD